jgi:GT2 family glycosyltransferase
MRDSAVLLAETIAVWRPASVLVAGPAPPVLAVELRRRGVAVTGVDAIPPGGRYAVVVWYPEDDPLPPGPDRVAPALAALSDDIVVVGVAPAAVWAEAFAAIGFYLHPDAGMPSGLLFRRVAGIPAEVEALRQELSRRQAQIDRLDRLLRDKDQLIAQLRRDVAVMATSLGWRLLEVVRGRVARVLRYRLARRLYPGARRALELVLDDGLAVMIVRAARKLMLGILGRGFRVPARGEPSGDLDGQYRFWLERQRAAPADATAEAALSRLSTTPEVSLLAVQNVPDPSLFRRTVESLRGQVYPRWQLCLAVPAAVHAALKPAIDGATSSEPRLTVAVSEVAAATLGDAMRVATGALIGVVDPGDLLAPDALLALVEAFETRPRVDLVYSDEDLIDANGRRSNPCLKPDWSPDLLLATNYLGRLVLVRRSVIDTVGGFRPEFGSGAAYDLWLRVAEETDRIVRVPKVLYHRWPPDPAGPDRDAVAMHRFALLAALRRRALDGDVEPLPIPFGAEPAFVPRFRLRGCPLVSIVIPTRDRRPFLEQAIRSVLDRTAYDRYEVVVVDNDSRDPETLDYLERLTAPCRVVRWSGEFNFSAICNFGARHAEGDQLLFLNNDVEVLRPDWLTAMLEHAQRPEVGVVGAKLLYPDGRIQHAGIVVGVADGAVHAFRRWPGEPERGLRLADLVRDCSAVTAACMMVRRLVFEEAKGFDEAFRVAFNDVDLCLRILARDRRVVYTPRALLVHWEGATRGRVHPAADQRLFEQRWAAVIARGDPYYPPALTDVLDRSPVPSLLGSGAPRVFGSHSRRLQS